ncbi:MAG: hypothetical protein ACREV5_23445 [Steroidobacter sp.]
MPDSTTLRRHRYWRAVCDFRASWLQGIEQVGRGASFGRPSNIEIDEERQIAFVSDAAYDAVFVVDLKSGDRQVISK